MTWCVLCRTSVSQVCEDCATLGSHGRNDDQLVVMDVMSRILCGATRRHVRMVVLSEKRSGKRTITSLENLRCTVVGARLVHCAACCSPRRTPFLVQNTCCTHNEHFRNTLLTQSGHISNTVSPTCVRQVFAKCPTCFWAAVFVISRCFADNVNRDGDNVKSNARVSGMLSRQAEGLSLQDLGMNE